MSSPEAEAALARVERAHAQLLHTKEAIKAEVEFRWSQELDALRKLESHYANEARSAGASYTKIGRAMGTSDWRTIKERLAYAGEEEK